jgi:uncharacterized tellurite resistance protein B-like protein
VRAGEPIDGMTVLNEMTREERLLLLRFVCSFAWADDQMREEERALVRHYVDKLRLDDIEQRQVQAWLRRPPPAESVDPDRVPARHRVAFVRAIESIIAVDGEIAPAERDRLIELANMLHETAGRPDVDRDGSG